MSLGSLQASCCEANHGRFVIGYFESARVLQPLIGVLIACTKHYLTLAADQYFSRYIFSATLSAPKCKGLIARAEGILPR